MSNRPILSIKLSYSDERNSVEDAFNQAVKVLNSSFSPSINDLMPNGSILQSTNSEDIFKSQVGQNWSQIGSTVISGITINIFQKIN